ncbi:MAG TPA: tetratricopeptide repeat protein [Candidatus Polarisedimenticolaceae bacterium]|nr:tetratricopeptide repeat protein [Candidatus Polarisedimenticolaceae bacterium]
MPLQSAEQFFRRGVARLSEAHAAEAAHHFLTAIQLEREHGVRRPEMRYLSFFGLSLALAGGSLGEAIRACQTAVARDHENPDLHFNLARVHLLDGDPRSALRAAGAGLALDPAHRGLRSVVGAVERRRRPPLRFLTRDHPVNRVLGRLRASLRAHEKAPPAGGERGFPSL